MNKILYCCVISLLGSAFAKAQSPQYSKIDSTMLRSIYNYNLTESDSYEWLDYLSNNIGGRLSGSIQAERAVDYTENEIKKFADRTELQSVMVPKWSRGTPEFAYIQLNDLSTINVNICALGGSIPTRQEGLKAPVIEVKSLEELSSLGREQIEGKIVFYNRPMDPKKIQTFEAYGGCVDQRYSGAEEAGKYGAVAVIVRSMNLRLDDYPHTGFMSYGDLPVENFIPAAAISTNDAEKLSAYLALDKELKFYLKQDCTVWGDVESFNVIGEIKGTRYPDEYIIVGGHLDSWDLGDGSHDDGAGVVQSMQVLKTLKELNYKPQRTIMVVLFMNEENGLKGAREYAKQAELKNEKHIFALESDAGGFSPRGFSFDTTTKQMKVIESWKPLFKPYLIHFFELGGSGADVGPLKGANTVLAGLRPDSQRYFDFHHAANDTFDAVNKRELELGAATMTSLVYLFDKYGIEN
ncbi:PA domain-containing protein [Nonlabens dokdonensis]|uniref:Carboxypeptidase Q n=2 Tax=Nonlabens dokdonensis TaxID=328515 RepID=L7WEZ7_NONDD|nr:M20/M25/M40 family metallo-hydrolase [Nonlabens dokdonensis]AGC77458.1 peptidase, M28D family protein [Nonlabens dokdonensis DSW-6]PZX40981.1 PA domain-containing protein [Nonlabens dokdonensis]